MEEAKFNLLCVYDPEAIIKSWPVITHGLEVMLENAGSDTSMDKIFNDLMAGRLLLWVAMLNGEYVGFVTTQVVDVPPRVKHLWVVHAFKAIKTPTIWLLRAYEMLEEFAVSRQCKSVRFYAKSRPWQSKFLDNGYHIGYLEFVKPLRGESNEGL